LGEVGSDDSDRVCGLGPSTVSCARECEREGGMVRWGTQGCAPKPSVTAVPVLMMMPPDAPEVAAPVERAIAPVTGPAADRSSGKVGE
jgi:hypothetical protein